MARKERTLTMDDLIRRKDALQAIAQLPLPYGVQRDKIITALYEVPAVDAEPVVRCKDCKHYKIDTGISPDFIGYFCDLSNDYSRFPFDFCSDGERGGKA